MSEVDMFELLVDRMCQVSRPDKLCDVVTFDEISKKVCSFIGRQF